jgi:hypothetical protein
MAVRTWTVHADGSLSLDIPALTDVTDIFNGQLLYSLTADHRLHSALLQGTIGVVDDSTGETRSTAPVSIKIDGIVPHDFNGDGKADLYQQDAHGVVWLFAGTGNPKAPLGRARRMTNGFFSPIRSAVTIPYLKHGSNQLFVEMNKPGELDTLLPDQNGVPDGYEIVKGDFGAYTLLTGSADLAGGAFGGYGDLLARDRSGHLWLYPGIDNPAYNIFFGNRIQVPGNWSGINAMVAPGDLTGDGKPDLLVRRTNGSLWLYPGTGNPKAPFGKPVDLGGNWNWAVNLVACGDMTGDGKPDLLARSKAGNVWLYPGTGSAKAPFGRSILAANGWSRAITVF